MGIANLVPRWARRQVATWTLSAAVVAAVVAGATAGIVATRLTENDVAAPATTQGLPDIPGMIDTLRPSVVALDVETLSMEGSYPMTGEVSGTGIILTSDGLIATNAHVVEDAESIVVTLADGTEATGRILGVDDSEDLAVLSIDERGLQPIALGRSSELRVGDLVVAIGNALSLQGGPTASLGIVSALERKISTSWQVGLAHLIQTDAALNDGNSGGPLVDQFGHLVGINSGRSVSAENIGFAIAIDHALPILEELANRDFAR
ncbi:MAG: S1C family serine protease [Dehalococcoidia bacterium]